MAFLRRLPSLLWSYVALTEKSFVVLLLSLVLAGPVYAENKLIFLTEEWKPFSFSGQENAVDGFTTAIVKRIACLLGNDISIHVVPWSRAYATVKEKEHHAIFSLYRTKAREEHFKWVGPVYSVDTMLWGLQSRNLDIKDLEDAKKYKIIVQKDSAYEQFLIEKGFKNYTLNPSRTDVYMVARGRGDLVPLSAFSVDKLKRSMADFVKPDDRWKAYTILHRKSLYIGFNKNTSDELVRQWQLELDYLKQHSIFSDLENRFIQPARDTQL